LFNIFNFKAILHGEEEVRQWLECGEVPWKKVDNRFFVLVANKNDVSYTQKCCYNEGNKWCLAFIRSSWSKQLES